MKKYFIKDKEYQSPFKYYDTIDKDFKCVICHYNTLKQTRMYLSLFDKEYCYFSHSKSELTIKYHEL